MNKKEKFREELIELLWRYDMSVVEFLEEINKTAYWIDTTQNWKLKRLLKGGYKKGVQ